MNILRAVGVGLKAVLKGLGVVGRATIALVGVAGVTAAIANYTMTQGAGTTFGSIVVSTVHYAQMLICDPTTPAQCGAVNASGNQLFDWTTGSQAHADLIAPTPAGTFRIGYVSDDPCTQKLKLNAPIATSSGNLQLVAGVAAQKVYVCSVFIVGASAFVGSIIEGTGAACTTANEAAVIGSTTAASGGSFSANGGWVEGNGGAEIGVTATAANGICLLQSGTVALSGNVTYVQQ